MNKHNEWSEVKVKLKLVEVKLVEVKLAESELNWLQVTTGTQVFQL